MKLTREYAHKTFGAIGTVRLELTPDGLVLDEVRLGESGTAHLLNHALQSLQDAYAGAKTADEARASWAKKLEKILDGTIGSRTTGGGAGLGAIEKRMIAMVRDNFKKAVSGYKDMKPAERDAAIWELICKQSEAAQKGLAKRAEAAIAREEAERASLADLGFDLDAMGDGDDESDTDDESAM